MEFENEKAAVMGFFVGFGVGVAVAVGDGAGFPGAEFVAEHPGRDGAAPGEDLECPAGVTLTDTPDAVETGIEIERIVD